jgi:hypothetical protein
LSTPAANVYSPKGPLKKPWKKLTSYKYINFANTISGKNSHMGDKDLINPWASLEKYRADPLQFIAPKSKYVIPKMSGC